MGRVNKLVHVLRCRFPDIISFEICRWDIRLLPQTHKQTVKVVDNVYGCTGINSNVYVCEWEGRGRGCNFIWAVHILLIINSLNSQALQNNFMMKCIISLQWLSIPCFDLEDSVHTIATVHEGEFGYNDGDGHLNFEGKKKHNKEIISYLKNIHHTLLYYQKRPNLNLVVELDRVKTTIESSINSLQSQ